MQQNIFNWFGRNMARRCISPKLHLNKLQYIQDIYVIVEQLELGMWQAFFSELSQTSAYIFRLFKPEEFLSLITMITGCDRICKITVSRTCSFSLTRPYRPRSTWGLQECLWNCCSLTSHPSCNTAQDLHFISSLYWAWTQLKCIPSLVFASLLYSIYIYLL